MNKELLKKMFQGPGLFTPSELTVTASILETFVIQFRMWESILGAHSMNANTLQHNVDTLQKTAKLVAERDK